MRRKKITGMILLIVSTMWVSATFAENSLTIYVSKDTDKCVSFNLVKLDKPTTVDNRTICPGEYNGFWFLADGQYNLYAMELNMFTSTPYGNMEYVKSPLVLDNAANLAVYYPMAFKIIN